MAIVALALCVVLCAGIALSLPIGAGADEWGHLEYAGHVWAKGTLPGADDLRSAQAGLYPFLYYGYLALARGVLSHVSRAVETGELELPYERRIVVSGGDVDDPMRIASCEAPCKVRGTEPYLWRLLGIVPLVAVVALVFWACWRSQPGNLTIATLAAAVGVLVPQLAATFGTITNDHFAILFSSAACAVVFAGAAKSSLTLPKLTGAGVLLALGLLSKASVVGAMAACTVVVLGCEGRRWGRRLTDLIPLLAPSLLGVGWWYVDRILQTGHLDVALMVGAHHPEVLRIVEPDAWGLAQAVGLITESWLGQIGSEFIRPGALMTVVGLAVPVLIVGGSLLAVMSSKAGRRDRAMAGAFLSGVALMVGLMVSGNRYSGLTHGRHLLTLVVPGSIACEIAMRRLFGINAGRVLAASATWLGLMGMVLLHLQIIPRYHPPHDRFTSPDFVAYVDAGAMWAQPFAQRGHAAWEGSTIPRPESSFLADPVEASVRISGLDAEQAYWVLMRVHPTARGVVTQEAFADDLPLGGMVTPLGLTGWLEYPLPMPSVSDGSVVIAARSIDGGATLAEVLLTRVPVRVGLPAKLDGDTLVVMLTSSAPDRLPPLEARVTGEDDIGSESVPVDFVDGTCELRIRLPEEVNGPLLLDLVPPVVAWVDVKMAEAVHPPAARAVHEASPGLDVVRVPAGVRPGAVVMVIPAITMEPGRYRVELVDERGRPIPGGMLAIGMGSDKTRQDVASAELDVPGRTPLRFELAYLGGAPFFVDRLRFLRKQPWSFATGIVR